MQKGIGNIIAVAVVVVVLLAVGILKVMQINAYDKNIYFKSNITNLSDQSYSMLSAVTLKIRNLAKVPAMYSEDLTKYVSAAMSSRYGEDGMKAMVAFMNENNIQFDSSMYKNIQIAMSGGQDDFRITQNKLTDFCAQYRVFRSTWMTGHLLGDATTDLDSVKHQCTIALDAYSRNAESTKVITETELR